MRIELIYRRMGRPPSSELEVKSSLRIASNDVSAINAVQPDTVNAGGRRLSPVRYCACQHHASHHAPIRPSIRRGNIRMLEVEKQREGERRCRVRGGC